MCKNTLEDKKININTLITHCGKSMEDIYIEHAIRNHMFE